jgi:hypothetical protein
MQCCNKRQVALQCATLQYATDTNHGWGEVQAAAGNVQHNATRRTQRARHATSHTRRRTRNHLPRNTRIK